MARIALKAVARAPAPSCLTNVKPRAYWLYNSERQEAHTCPTDTAVSPAPDLLGANPCCCLERRCHLGAIIAVVIVLGFVVYEVSRIVAHASTAATSAPRTTGHGSRAP